MKRPLDLFEQRADVVQAQTGPERPEVARLHHEWGSVAGLKSGGEAATQGVVDDVAKRPAGSARLRFELRGHVIVESQGCAHILML